MASHVFISCMYDNHDACLRSIDVEEDHPPFRRNHVDCSCDCHNGDRPLV